MFIHSLRLPTAVDFDPLHHSRIKMASLKDSARTRGKVTSLIESSGQFKLFIYHLLGLKSSVSSPGTQVRLPENTVAVVAPAATSLSGHGLPSKEG